MTPVTLEKWLQQHTEGKAKSTPHLSSWSSSVAIIISILHPVWQSLNKCSVITPLAIWIQHLATLNLVACSSSDIGLNSYTISTRECESKTFEFLIGNFERGGWHHSQTTRRRTRPHILPRNLHIIFPELLYNSDLERTEQEENTHLTQFKLPTSYYHLFQIHTDCQIVIFPIFIFGNLSWLGRFAGSDILISLLTLPPAFAPEYECLWLTSKGNRPGSSWLDFDKKNSKCYFHESAHDKRGEFLCLGKKRLSIWLCYTRKWSRPGSSWSGFDTKKCYIFRNISFINWTDTQMQDWPGAMIEIQRDRRVNFNLSNGRELSRKPFAVNMRRFFLQS